MSFQCDDCNHKPFMSMKGLIIHQAKMHKDDNTNKCQKCLQYTSDNKSNLNRHMKICKGSSFSNTSKTTHNNHNNITNHNYNDKNHHNVYNIQSTVNINTTNSSCIEQFCKQMTPITKQYAVESSQKLFTRLKDKQIMLTSLEVLAKQMQYNEFANTLYAVDKSRDKNVYVNGDKANVPIVETDCFSYINFIEYGFQQSQPHIDAYKQLIHNKVQSLPKNPDPDDIIPLGCATSVVSKVEKLANNLKNKDEFSSVLAKTTSELKNLEYAAPSINHIEAQMKYKLILKLTKHFQTQITVQAKRLFFLSAKSIGKLLAHKLVQHDLIVKIIHSNSLSIDGIPFDWVECFELIKEAFSNNYLHFAFFQKEFCTHVDDINEHKTIINYEEFYSNYQMLLGWIINIKTNDVSFAMFEQSLQSGFFSYFEQQQLLILTKCDHI